MSGDPEQVPMAGEAVGRSRLWSGRGPGFLGTCAFRAKSWTRNIGAMDACNHNF